MSSKLQISIPQAASWLLRLAAHPQLSDNLCRDAVAFSAWYAAANGLIDWPDEVETIQRTERAKKLSLDRVMKLLAQMNHTFSGRASAEQAKLLLEGYAVHDWVSDNSLVFRALASDKQETLGALDDISDHAREAISPFAARLHQLGRILGLSALVQDILAFAFLTTASQELAGIFEQLAENRWTAGILWTALFKTNTEELGKAMRPNSPLRLSGMLMAAGRRVQIARVSEFWIDLIAGGESVFDSLSSAPSRCRSFSASPSDGGGGHVRPSCWDWCPSPIGYSTCWCTAPTCRCSPVMTCINRGSGSVSGGTHGPRPAWNCCWSRWVRGSTGGLRAQ
jgi:hypothetical protein